MTQESYKHPITPPPELVQQIALQAIDAIPDDECGAVEIDEAREEYIANFFAQWGADQELEACEKWLEWNHSDLLSRELRAARRPKPPSLKEQALDVLHLSFDRGYLKEGAADTIRRALEQLDD